MSGPEKGKSIGVLREAQVQAYSHACKGIEAENVKCDPRLSTAGFYVNKADKELAAHVSESEGVKLQAGQ